MTPHRTETSRPGTQGRLTNHLPALRRMLEEQRDIRLGQLAEIERELADLTGDVREGARHQMSLSLAAGTREALIDIDGALRRMDEGRYGRCETCAVDIPTERLEIIPQARLCVPCQRTRESRG
ncbi:MAG: TraR/DksA family transcriptional regulator [Streptosporangiaceae bacterium]